MLGAMITSLLSDVQGLCLTKNQKPPVYIVALVDWLWARVVAFVLWPLHMLAEKLVHKKIRSSIGITKVVLQHSTSLSLFSSISIAQKKTVYLQQKYCENDFFVFSRLVLVEVVVYLCILTSFLRLDKPILFLEVRDKRLLSTMQTEFILGAGHRCECTKWIWFDRNLTGCLCAKD